MCNKGLRNLKRALSHSVVHDLAAWGEWFDIKTTIDKAVITIEVLQRDGWHKYVMPYDVGKVRLLMELGSKVARWGAVQEKRMLLKNTATSWPRKNSPTVNHLPTAKIARFLGVTSPC